MPSQGFVIAASGEDYIETAVEAAVSLKAAMPDVPVDLFTDIEGAPGTEIFDQIHMLDKSWFRPKFESLVRSRFDKTVYMDADVRCLADMSDIFTVLDRFDIAMVHDPLRNSPHAQRVWKTALPNAFPHLNGGLVGIRASDEVLAFLREVQETIIAEDLKSDQALIREKLFDSDLRLAVLPPEYNFLDYRQAEMFGFLHSAPRLLHHYKFHSRHNKRLDSARSVAGLVGPDLERHLHALIEADAQLTPGTSKKVRPLVDKGVLGKMRKLILSAKKGIVRLWRS
ncbi:putative nucleotide-diphospho-sugar transferase [Ruegeria sp. Ofav3-42]|uniref:putative nucleotide-diphospho-sugar transferase n=1 Tax=Ruegeria sp. Ofav3-42 TaxID=2917759 RepID=UPI001EF71239|nr:putative nucleotide-diphospho-sugar transferase [Ruegeria sp. Ofav3-42]MCG7520182.1 putative nucleotide-diphospho-sugar transferase [Ruegeria sp. Ofav3-42]